MENSPFRNYDLRNDGPVLTPVEIHANDRRWREYLNTVADNRAAYTKARKRVNRAQKKARRLNRNR